MKRIGDIIITEIARHQGEDVTLDVDGVEIMRRLVYLGRTHVRGRRRRGEPPSFIDGQDLIVEKFLLAADRVEVKLHIPEEKLKPILKQLEAANRRSQT